MFHPNTASFTKQFLSHKKLFNAPTCASLIHANLCSTSPSLDQIWTHQSNFSQHSYSFEAYTCMHLRWPLTNHHHTKHLGHLLQLSPLQVTISFHSSVHLQHAIWVSWATQHTSTKTKCKAVQGPNHCWLDTIYLLVIYSSVCSSLGPIMIAILSSLFATLKV